MANKTYALAHNLIGFKSSTLRVIVTREERGNVWVTTADLLDAGTQLVLDASQVEPDPSEFVEVISHKDGLVSFIQ